MSKTPATYGVFEQTLDDKGKVTLVLRYNPGPFAAVIAGLSDEIEAGPDATLFLAEVRQQDGRYIFDGEFYTLVASTKQAKAWDLGQVVDPPVKTASIHI